MRNIWVFYLSILLGSGCRGQNDSRAGQETTQDGVMNQFGSNSPTELDLLVTYHGLAHYPVVHTPTNTQISVRPDGSAAETALEYCGSQNEECVDQLTTTITEMGEELNTTLMGLASEGQIGTLMMPVKHENGSIQTLTRALYREPTSIEFSTLRTDEDCNRGKVDFGTCDQLVHVGRQEGLKSEMGALRVGLDYIANDANRGTGEEDRGAKAASALRCIIYDELRESPLIDRQKLTNG